MKNSFFDFRIFKVPEDDLATDLIAGDNKKGIILFFEGDETEQESLISFMAKVFQAIQVDLEQDTHFINIKFHSNLNLSTFLQKKQVNSVLLFGIKPQTLGIQFALPPYLLIKHQKVQYLSVDDLNAIYEERQNGGKKMSGQLWRAIQQLAIN